MTLPVQRRSFLTLLCGAAAAWPLGAGAQQAGPMRRVGVLMGFAEEDQEMQARLAAFQQGLEKLGWTNGRNIRFDVRWSGGDTKRMQAYAGELVRLAPDAILVNTQGAVAALSQETRSTPIVFAQVLDPVGFGLVPSLARPGGNVTGFTSFEYSIGGKWIELLKEVVPRVRRIAIIYDRQDPAAAGFLKACEAVAPTLEVELRPVAARNAAEIESGINAFSREADGAMIIQPTAVATANRNLIMSLALRHRLPAAYPYRFWAVDGGLMSYGFDNLAQYRGAASYVDRILKGAKPADLPVQAPTKFELIVNLKTAKSMGLTISESFLLRADEVIE